MLLLYTIYYFRLHQQKLCRNISFVFLRYFLCVTTFFGHRTTKTDKNRIKNSHKFMFMLFMPFMLFSHKYSTRLDKVLAPRTIFTKRKSCVQHRPTTYYIFLYYFYWWPNTLLGLLYALNIL